MPTSCLTSPRPGLRLAIAAALLGVLAIAPNMARPASAAFRLPRLVSMHPMSFHLSRTISAHTGGRRGALWLIPPSVCVALIGADCYTPAEMRKFYNVPPTATGAGQTIVIIDAYGNPFMAQDLADFDAAMALPPPPSFKTYYPEGPIAFNASDSNQLGWSSEVALDVEWAHALAPAASIALVVARSNSDLDLTLAEGSAVSAHLGNVISMSFGTPESFLLPNYYPDVGDLIGIGLHRLSPLLGITTLAASGDFGANNNDPNNPPPASPATSPSYPAVDPNLTGVGGTNAFANDDGSRRAAGAENVWNDADNCPYGCNSGPYGATGGAPSAVFSPPSYQLTAPGGFPFATRAASDVAWNAGVYTAVLVHWTLGGQGADDPSVFWLFGGTSVGTQAWAGIVADVDQAVGHGVGNINPFLYAHPGAFYDITSGDNGYFGPGYSARPGWDAPTGLGTPNVAALISAFTH